MERRVRNFLSSYFNVEKEDRNIFVLAVEELRKNIPFQTSIYDAITINHSYFFRNTQQWDYLSNVIKENQWKELKIWSAGCSSGEEPYTLAMILKTCFPSLRFTIFASDIDKKILEKAKEGVYDRFSLEREIDDSYLKKYFIQQDDKFFLDNTIKSCVSFREHNLLEKPFEKQFDIVICRNVLIYFSAEGKETIHRHFSDALKEKGVLFLGPTEQFFNCDDFGFSLLKPSFYLKKS
jgi:chemotaxis protein methyltransferase CheR